MRYTKDIEVAKDIVHNVFVKFWEHTESHTEIADPFSFLKTMTKNASLNFVRNEATQSRHKDIILQDSENFSQEIELEEETYRLLEKAIASLPERSRQIMYLSLKGFKNAEIAEKLEISVNTVKTLKYRAIDSLKNTLSSKYYIFLLIKILNI